jgi:hypothetical protein
MKWVGGSYEVELNAGGGAPTPMPPSAWAYINYTYAANHPHAVSALSTGETYTYDNDDTTGSTTG